MADEQKKKQFNKYPLYENGKAKNKSCPRCGPGVFMAIHSNRVACGKCGYTETENKPEQTQEQPKAEQKEQPKESAAEEAKPEETPAEVPKEEKSEESAPEKPAAE